MSMFVEIPLSNQTKFREKMAMSLRKGVYEKLTLE